MEFDNDTEPIRGAVNPCLRDTECVSGGGSPEMALLGGKWLEDRLRSRQRPWQWGAAQCVGMHGEVRGWCVGDTGPGRLRGMELAKRGLHIRGLQMSHL